MKRKHRGKKLRNIYYVQRHGESRPQKLGIIVSCPRQGTQKRFGLTKTGMLQSEENAKKARIFLGSDTIILHSPFSRTKDTASITAKILGVKNVLCSHRLRERYFGIWEETSDANYKKVWDDDRRDPTHRNHQGESVQDVEKRILALIAKLENDYTGKNILLVSHGDVLHIAACHFSDRNPALHRTIPSFETGEIRRLENSISQQHNRGKHDENTHP